MHGEKGFTLTEVMVAMMILAVALVALAGMQLVAIHVNADAKITTQMAAVAQQSMEEMLALPYNHIDLQDNDPADITQKTTYKVKNPPQGHTIQWTVNDNVVNPQLTIKSIDLTVTRKVNRKNDKTLTLSFARSSLGS